MRNHYAIWAVERFTFRFVAYIVLLPVLVAMFPLATVSNLLGRAFYWLSGGDADDVLSLLRRSAHQGHLAQRAYGSRKTGAFTTVAFHEST